MNKKINILILGCGQIGFRHFQSVLEFNQINEIVIVDLLKKRKEKFFDYYDKHKRKKKIKIHFHQKLKDCLSHIDLAIISTSSMQRGEMIDELYEYQRPKYLILEKFLFTKFSDYSKFEKFFKKTNTLVWVNQWMSGEFFFLKNFINKKKRVTLSVYGDNWGLCCNSVHFIDLFLSIINNDKISRLKNNLNKNIYKSKRDGYYEIFGSLKFQSQKGHELNILCNKKKKKEIKIYFQIKNDQNILNCEIRNNELIILNDKNQRKIHKIKYQSERTHLIIKEIVKHKKCSLPTFKESILHHKLVFRPFFQIFSKKNIDFKKGIPIT